MAFFRNTTAFPSFLMRVTTAKPYSGNHKRNPFIASTVPNLPRVYAKLACFCSKFVALIRDKVWLQLSLPL